MLEQYISNSYLRAGIILFLMVIFLKVVLSFVFIISKKIARRTKIDLDNILIDKAKNPITLLIILLSVKLALEQIVLNEFVGYSLSKIIYTLLIVTLTYLVYVIMDLGILGGIKNILGKTRTRVDKSILSIIHNALKVIVILVSALYILDTWGIKIGLFLAGLGIAGLAVALALQPTLSNIFSGISMVLDKTIRVGDLVYIDSETKGKISKVGFRSTRIITFDNELVIIPNTKLADSKIQNVALPEPKSRVVIPFSVAYGSDIDKVKRIVLKEINSIAEVEKDPAPLVRFLEMAESSLKFKAYFHVGHFDKRFPSIDEANTRIYNALRKNKISIPFPQMDVHIRKK